MEESTKQNKTKENPRNLEPKTETFRRWDTLLKVFGGISSGLVAPQ